MSNVHPVLQATLDAWNPTKSGTSAETVRLMVAALQAAHHSLNDGMHLFTLDQIEQALDAAGAPYQAGE